MGAPDTRRRTGVVGLFKKNKAVIKHLTGFLWLFCTHKYQKVLDISRCAVDLDVCVTQI